jgi:hypothetical protein
MFAIAYRSLTGSLRRELDLVHMYVVSSATATRAQPLSRRNGSHRSSRFGLIYCIFTLPEAALQAPMMRGRNSRSRVVVVDLCGDRMDGEEVAGVRC